METYLHNHPMYSDANYTYSYDKSWQLSNYLPMPAKTLSRWANYIFHYSQKNRVGVVLFLASSSLPMLEIIKRFNLTHNMPFMASMKIYPPKRYGEDCPLNLQACQLLNKQETSQRKLLETKKINCDFPAYRWTTNVYENRNSQDKISFQLSSGQFAEYARGLQNELSQTKFAYYMKKGLLIVDDILASGLTMGSAYYIASLFGDIGNISGLVFHNLFGTTRFTKLFNIKHLSCLENCEDCLCPIPGYWYSLEGRSELVGHIYRKNETGVASISLCELAEELTDLAHSKTGTTYLRYLNTFSGLCEAVLKLTESRIGQSNKLTLQLGHIIGHFVKRFCDHHQYQDVWKLGKHYQALTFPHVIVGPHIYKQYEDLLVGQHSIVNKLIDTQPNLHMMSSYLEKHWPEFYPQFFIPIINSWILRKQAYYSNIMGHINV